MYTKFNLPAVDLMEASMELSFLKSDTRVLFFRTESVNEMECKIK